MKLKNRIEGCNFFNINGKQNIVVGSRRLSC